MPGASFIGFLAGEELRRPDVNDRGVLFT